MLFSLNSYKYIPLTHCNKGTFFNFIFQFAPSVITELNFLFNLNILLNNHVTKSSQNFSFFLLHALEFDFLQFEEERSEREFCLLHEVAGLFFVE